MITELYDGNPVLPADPTLARWAKMMKAGGQEAATATRELISSQTQGTLPAPVRVGAPPQGGNGD